MTTRVVSFSDATIRRFAENGTIIQLRDPRYSLRFRYGKDRSTGSWHLYKCLRGREVWRKIGNWPNLKAKVVISQLSAMEAKLAIDLESDTLDNGFQTIAELLTWYRDRAAKDRNISPSRKSSIKWAINKHLLPRIGMFNLLELNHDVVDEHLLWSMQEVLAVGSVRSVWNVLNQAFRRALKLKKIQHNVVASVKFSDAIEASCTPKATEIQTDQLPAILLLSLDVTRMAQMLSLWMLLHGTRIGETRRAKWTHIDLQDKQWNIPAENTKTKQPHILPLTDFALQVLNSYRAWQQAKGYQGVFLFPNNRQRSSINHNKANKLIKELSGGEWRSHSLRKIARTTWLNIGIDYMIGEMLLNHAMTKVDQAYIQTMANTQKRQALTLWHNWLDIRSHFFLTDFGTETLPRCSAALNIAQPNHSEA